jgi:hypothetical protein
MVLGDARLLKQLDGVPTGADEDDPARPYIVLERVDILDAHR